MFKIIFALALSSTILSLDTDTCHRNLYLGSPVNTIHKAHEYLEHLLQASNAKSAVHYIGGSQSQNNNTGETYHDFLFRIDEEKKNFTKPKALIMRVTVGASGKTFVDDYILMNGPNGIGNRNDRLNWFLNNRYSLSALQNNFFNRDTWKQCNLIKESFTYFYEMYGSRFRKSLD